MKSEAGARSAIATCSVARQVFVGDDDLSGLIFFDTYRRWMSEGDQQLFTQQGHPVWEDLSAGFGAPVVRSELDCHAPARSGDLMEQEIVLHAAGRSSFSTTHRFTCRGSVVATGKNIRVWVDLATMTPCPAPDWTRLGSDDPDPSSTDGRFIE